MRFYKKTMLVHNNKCKISHMHHISDQSQMISNRKFIGIVVKENIMDVGPLPIPNLFT